MASLEGVIVVALTRYGAELFVDCALSGLGATVVMVEALSDEGRRDGWMLRRGHLESEPDDEAFVRESSNTERIAIDCGHPEGKVVTLDLISQADIFVTSLRTEALRRLGFDYETLHDAFPRLVWVQDEGCRGLAGRKDERSFDAVVSATRCASWGDRLYKVGDHAEEVVGLGFVVDVLSVYVHALRTGVGGKVVGSFRHGEILKMLMSSREDKSTHQQRNLEDLMRYDARGILEGFGYTEDQISELDSMGVIRSY